MLGQCAQRRPYLSLSCLITALALTTACDNKETAVVSAPEPASTPVSVHSEMAPGLDSQQKADWILDRWLALQLAPETEEVASRQMDGRVNLIDQALFGDIRVVQKGKDRVYRKVTFPGGRFLEEGYDAKQGWQRVTGKKVRNLSPEELASRRATGRLVSSDYKEKYIERRFISLGEVEGQAAFRLELTDDVGDRRVLYLDAKTFEVFKVRSVPAGKSQARSITLMKDYRRVDGILVPFFMHLEDDNGVQEIRVFEVKHNVDVNDKLFKRPR